MIFFKIGQYGCIFDEEDIEQAFKIKKGEDYKMYSRWMGKKHFKIIWNHQKSQ